MTAIEKLTKMNDDIRSTMKEVRAQYCTLELAARLTKRHGLVFVEDAIYEEARQRCRREKWASVTSN